MEFKDFNEASNSNRPFYQVMFYDRLHEYSGELKGKYYSTKKEVEWELKRMGKVNKELFDKMLETYGKYGITAENYRGNDIWNYLTNKLPWDEMTRMEKYLFRYDENRVGYCFIRVYRRDLKEEEREEEMANNNGKEDGPYGGAFEDWYDFYRWKEG